MWFLRYDQAKEFLAAAKTLREKLVSRYFLLNGLAPMELAYARIENLDPVDCTLFLRKRHWKKNCITRIDPGTVKLQIIYSGDRVEGPLIRTRQTEPDGRPDRTTMNVIVKCIAKRTTIPRKHLICPLVLKRTFAREWLKSGAIVGTLQKKFSHLHLASTEHYARFVMDDVEPDQKRFLEHMKEARPKRKRVGTDRVHV